MTLLAAFEAAKGAATVTPKGDGCRAVEIAGTFDLERIGAALSEAIHEDEMRRVVGAPGVDESFEALVERIRAVLPSALPKLK